MAELRSNVWVGGNWYGPSYPDAGDPPEGSVDRRAFEGDETPSVDDLTAVSEPSAPLIEPPAEYVVDPQARTASAEAGGPASGPSPPPKAGSGGSRQRWVEYATARDVTVTPDATRDEIIAACEAAGVRTE